MADRRTFRVDALVSASRPFKAFLFPFRARPKEPTLKVESLYCHDNEMFSLVSQMVIAQPPSANKKKQYKIRDVLERDWLVWKKSWCV